MRGKPNSQISSLVAQRITPAHAGKTAEQQGSGIGRADHPRACGENVRACEEMQQPDGSPPRMRGKLCLRVAADSHARITPAHAGKTSPRQSGGKVPADHPRACGENRPRLCCTSRHGGSPPRMRGKPADFCDAVAGLRITPAHAGKTLRKWRISVVDPSPQPQSSLTSRKADASSGSQRAPCAAPV